MCPTKAKTGLVDGRLGRRCAAYLIDPGGSVYRSRSVSRSKGVISSEVFSGYMMVPLSF